MTITVEQADTIHTARGNADWLGIGETAKSAAIINAQDYIAATYAPFQDGVDDENERVVLGTVLLARILHLNPAPMVADGALKEKEVESDGSRIKKVWQDADKVAAADPYPLITAILAPLRMSGGPNGLSFARVSCW